MLSPVLTQGFALHASDLGLLAVQTLRAVPWMVRMGTFAAPSQSAVGMAFAPQVAGRALSAYNLLIFFEVLVIQWGIGLMIDGLMLLGTPQALAFKLAFAVFLIRCIASYVHFRCAAGHNHAP